MLHLHRDGIFKSGKGTNLISIQDASIVACQMSKIFFLNFLSLADIQKESAEGPQHKDDQPAVNHSMIFPWISTGTLTA